MDNMNYDYEKHFCELHNEYIQSFIEKWDRVKIDEFVNKCDCVQIQVKVLIHANKVKRIREFNGKPNHTEAEIQQNKSDCLYEDRLKEIFYAIDEMLVDLTTSKRRKQHNRNTAQRC